MLVWIVFSTITYFVPLRQVGRAKRRGWIKTFPFSPFTFHLCKAEGVDKTFHFSVFTFHFVKRRG